MLSTANFKFGEIPSAAEGMRRGVLTFGKLAGLTYELALANDSEYCQWVVDNYSVTDEDEPKLKFVDWLVTKDRLSLKRKADQIAESDDEDDPKDNALRLVDFGKYEFSGLTYGEVVEKYPVYCQTLLEKQDHKLVSQRIRTFLEFVKASGVDLHARARLVRQQSRAASSRPNEDSKPPGLPLLAEGFDYSG